MAQGKEVLQLELQLFKMCFYNLVKIFTNEKHGITNPKLGVRVEPQYEICAFRVDKTGRKIADHGHAACFSGSQHNDNQ